MFKNSSPPGVADAAEEDACASGVIDISSISVGCLPSGPGEPLQQVVENLLANAFHALRHIDAPEVLPRVCRRSAEARISVRDTGSGVPAALRERIFELLFTTKGSEGTGVVLAICREFLARMGGALTLASGGTGACFRIRLLAA